MINYNYKLTEGESYGLEEQHCGTPYLPEYMYADKITTGKENVIKINAWKPIVLQLNMNIVNNNAPPLVAELNCNNNYTFGTEFTYEQTISKTVNIRTRPNSNIKIDFWYNKGKDQWGNSIRHLKTIDYKTSLDDFTALDFDIDCSQF